MITSPATTAATTEVRPDLVEEEDAGEDNEEDQENDQDNVAASSSSPSASKKKKKKKKGKKKTTASASNVAQTDPPTIPVSKLFPSGIYPVGEIQEYTIEGTTHRTTAEETRLLDKLAHEDPETTYENIRKGCEVHRQVRKSARKWIRPGMRMIDIADKIEDGVRTLVEENGLEAGIGFPTGLSINHCAAHYTPNPGDTKVLQQGDVLKVDIGVHVKGRITDSAFSLNFEPTYDKLLEAVEAATNTGIRESGIDARLGEIGGAIQETMESYEVEVNGKVYPVKSIANLSGHLITPYLIHGGSHGKSVNMVRNDDQTKMEEGEYYAIETFGSTGRGRAVEGGETSHYAKNPQAPVVPLRLTSAQTLLKTINKSFGTLPFCRRYLERAGAKSYLLGLNHLVAQGIIEDIPPLFDIEGSMTAQFEHTILLRPTVKEVVSRGDDY